MPSWHPLTPRWLRFAILAALASEAGSRGTVSPSLSSFIMSGARSVPRGSFPNGLPLLTASSRIGGTHRSREWQEVSA